MQDIKTFEGTLSNVGGRYALVVARFNSFVVEALLAGAVDTLVRHGVERADIEIIRVPGGLGAAGGGEESAGETGL